MFAVNRANLIAAGSETRFPGRKQHVTVPDPRGGGSPCGRGAAVPPGAWPARKGRSCTEHPASTSSRRPSSGGRSEGGVERDQGPGGIHARADLIPAGDLLVKPVPRSPSPDLGSRASASFFPRTGRAGRAGLGGLCPTPGGPGCPHAGGAPSFPTEALRPCRSFLPPSRGRCCRGRYDDAPRFYF